MFTRGCGSRADNFVGCKDGTIMLMDVSYNQTMCNCFDDFCNKQSDPELYSASTRLITGVALILIQAVFGAHFLRCL